MPAEHMQVNFPFGWQRPVTAPTSASQQSHANLYHVMHPPYNTKQHTPQPIALTSGAPKSSAGCVGCGSSMRPRYLPVGDSLYYPDPTPNVLNPYVTVTNPFHIATPHIGYPIAPKGHRDDLSLPLNPDSTIEVGFFDPKEAVPMTLYHPPDDPKLMHVKVWMKHPVTAAPVSMILTEFEARSIPENYVLPASKLPNGQWRVYAPGTRSEKRGVWPFGLM